MRWDLRGVVLGPDVATVEEVEGKGWRDLEMEREGVGWHRCLKRLGLRSISTRSTSNGHDFIFCSLGSMSRYTLGKPER